MREVKYDYDGVKSVTKLTDRQQEMLMWWQDFIKKNDDRLLAVDNTYAVMKTEKHGEIQFSNLLTSNLLGSSQYTVERVLFELVDVYNRVFAENEAKAYSIFRSKFNDFKNKYSFEKELLKVINEVENMTLTKKEPVKSMVYKVGKVVKEVTYFVYEPINPVAKIVLGDKKNLIELVKAHNALKLKTKFFREKYLSQKYSTLYEVNVFFEQCKNQEDMLLVVLKNEIDEKLMKILQEHPISSPDQIKVSFSVDLKDK